MTKNPKPNTPDLRFVGPDMPTRDTIHMNPNDVELQCVLAVVYEEIIIL